jgi:succinate-semialdehyde dehydrogenase / glutarate-semialdehyde dehydrogenase
MPGPVPWEWKARRIHGQTDLPSCAERTCHIEEGDLEMAYATVNPATGKQGPSFPEHTDREMEAALDRADDAYRAWRMRPIRGRADVVRKAAAVMRARSDMLARLITLEMGKLFVESKGEVELSAQILEYYADNAEKFLAPCDIPQADGSAVVVSDPIGIVFAIEPWNFPYYQVVRVAGPNLVTGNVMILKHAGSIPQCAEAIAKVFDDAGAPAGVFTNLRLSADQCSAVIRDPRVQGVALTGSNRAASSVAAQAGKVTKKSTMELGGSDPFIVLDDANLEMAIKWAVWSRFLNCGQGCADAKRFIAVEAVYDRFLKGLKDAVRDCVIGDPMDKATQLGPVSSESAWRHLQDQINRAVDGGATLVAGGRAVDRPGFYLQPTILADIPRGDDNPVFREEFFGPVFLVFKAKDEEDAVALANDTGFGLGSTIFSENVARAHALARRLDAGMVFVNHPLWTKPELPFGGVKASGYGRELGQLGIGEFVNKKLIRTQAATSEAF